MKKSIFTLLLSSIGLIAVAQPGTVAQPAPSPLMIVNTTPHTLGFEVRTHNYSDDYVPICYTTFQNLAGNSNLLYNNPMQVGVPLNLFTNGPVTAITPGNLPSPFYTLTPADLIPYGETQKWYEIKMCLSNTQLCGNLCPNIDDLDPSDLSEIAPGFSKDSDGVIWNTQGEDSTSYWHTLNSSDGYTATWNIISGMHFVLIS